MTRNLIAALVFGSMLWLVLPASAETSATTNTIVVGIDDSFPPYSFVNERGEADGFSVELLKAIAREQNLDLQLKVAPWHQIRQELERGDIDAIPAMYYSSVRAQGVSFTVPYVFEEIVLFYRKGTPAVTSLAELRGKRVGVELDGIANDFLRDEAGDIYPVPVNNTSGVLAMLTSEQIDYALLPRSVGLYLIQELGASDLLYVNMPDLHLGIALSLAVRKGDQILLERLNRGLTVAGGEGLYEALTQKWLAKLQPETLERNRGVKVVSGIIIVGGTIFLLVFFWSCSLRSQVRIRTQALEQEIRQRQKVQRTLKQQAMQQQAVAGLGQKALNDPDLHQLLREAEMLVSQLLGVRYVQFLRYSPTDDTLRPIVGAESTTLRKDTRRFSLRFDCLEGYTFFSKKPLVIEDIAVENRVVIPQPLISGDVVSCVRVNLESGEMPLGILCVDATEQRQFNLDEVNFIQSIANVIAEAIVRKLANIALSKSEEQFRAMFESAGIGMLLLDRSGRFILANPVVCEMLGYTQAEFLTLSVNKITYDEDLSHTKSYFADLLSRACDRYQTEKRYCCKDGNILWARLTISSFGDSSDEGAFCVAMIEDISERKKAESARELLETRLQQAHKMEAIGQLTAGIAHDFNNILASMMGYTGLAQEKYAASGEGKLANYLQQVYQGGERARDLIAQMLLFSRSQASTPQQLNPALLVGEVTKLLRASLPKTIDFVLVNEAEQGVINIDPVQAHQLLMNLCINARDAMNSKGAIEIGIRMVTACGERCTSCHLPVNGEFLEISVRDSGCGIEPEILSRVFEPFFTTKEVGKGTGMGLSAVHGIVHDHQGHLVVDSVPGTGSAFRLLFPLCRGTSQAQVAINHRPHESVPDGKEHILVVDDEPVLANYLKEFLSLHGYEVTLCEDGHQALTRIKNDPLQYDLMITDLAMPGMSGIELIQQVKVIRDELPIVLCTGYGENLEPSFARQQGIDKYFQKPVSADDLLKEIKQCLMKRNKLNCVVQE